MNVKNNISYLLDILIFVKIVVYKSLDICNEVEEEEYERQRKNRHSSS